MRLVKGFIGIDKILKFKHLIVALCFLVSTEEKIRQNTFYHDCYFSSKNRLLRPAYRKKPIVIKLHDLYSGVRKHVASTQNILKIN